MAEPRMSDTEYAAYKPYVEELLTLLDRQIRQHPDPKVLAEAWRIGYMSALVAVIRASRLLPADIDDFLSRVCTHLVTDTKQSVHNWDAEGPGR